MTQRTGLRIRAFERRDADAVVALWRACGLIRPWNDPRRDIERKLSVQPELFLVGVDGEDATESIVASGMFGYDGHRGSVYYLSVSPLRRHRGYGAVMLREGERRLRAMGCPKVNLLVRTSNIGVMAFYAKLGYAKDDCVGLGHRLVDDLPPEAPP